jgi:tRNA (adenine37-N6)-methyltransferase
MGTRNSRNSFVVFIFVWVASSFFTPTTFAQTKVKESDAFQVFPIGKVVKEGDRTFIVLDKKYEPGLLGLDKFSFVTVIYWFDRNDTSKKRSILQVHPRGNKKNPLRGVFATHSPVRPNLIGVSRCKIVSVKNNIIEIEDIDAFSGSPVIDLKS